MAVVEKVVQIYYDMLETADPAINDWAMLGSPWPTIICVCLYLIIVIVGPKLMEHRKPFELKSLVTYYDFSLSFINLWLVVKIISSTMALKYNWLCEPLTRITTNEDIELASHHYIFFLLKFYEFLDTFFFILRKKNNQISVLHVFHHSSVPVLCWSILKVHPIGMSFLIIGNNSFVHFVMYSYYGLTALGPWIQKYLWWKKYLTQLQLIQFVLAILNVIIASHKRCYRIPNMVFFVVVPYMVMMMIMFGNFYMKTYRKMKSRTL